MVGAAVAQAQPSPSVPLGDPAYAQLDQVVGSGLVRTVIYGQRPFTRREIARIAAEARAQLALPAHATRVSVATRRTLESLARRFPTQDDQAGLRRFAPMARTELLLLDSPSRAIPPAPVGTVQADVNPLLNARGGRRYGQGPTLAFEGGASAALGQHLLVQLQPRVAGGVATRGGRATPFLGGALQSAALSASRWNLRVDVGRQPLVWGQALDGGLLLSASGPPLDMIRVSTEAPWRAPWVFKWLGMLRGSALLADLGPRQNFPHAKLAAYKLSGQITSYFEFSASVMAQQGGRGAPTTDVWNRFIDLVPALKYALPDDDSQFSNKFAGWDMRFRIPPLHGAQLYMESVFDDMDPRRWRSTWWEDGGHIVGASLAQLGPEGAWGAVAEYHHTGLRYYQHTVFSSGLSSNRTLLGDPLGPQGDGGLLRITRDAGTRTRVQLDLALERRGGDAWGTTADNANNDNFRFVLERARPAEWRQRAMVQWQRTMYPGTVLGVQAGVERVRDAASVPGVGQGNAMAGVTWMWVPQ